MSAQDRDIMPLYDDLNLSTEARAFVDRVCRNQPVRRVGGGPGHVSVQFPSRLMQRSVQAESQYGELATVMQWEWDDRVRAYYCQPTTLKLRYRSSTGRRTGSRHTPDYMLIHDEGVDLVEVTTPNRAEQRASKWPDRMKYEPDYGWRSPAGEEAAAQLGVNYRVSVPEDPDIRFLRNARHLWEYFRTEPTDDQAEAIDKIVGRIAEEKALTVADLEVEVGVEPVRYAIAHGQVYFRLWDDLLPHDPTVCIYSDPLYADAAYYTAHAKQGDQPTVVRLERETKVDWQGVRWSVINVGDAAYTLQDTNGNLQCLTSEACAKLIASDELRPLTVPVTDADRLTELRRQASPKEIERAVGRCRALNAWRAGESWPENRYTNRSLRNWAHRHARARDAHGDGFLGLIDRWRDSGNKDHRLSEQAHELLDQSLWHDYGRNGARSARAAYVDYLGRAQEAALEAVSYERYRKMADDLDQGRLVAARSGAKAKYQRGPESPHDRDPDAQLPAHGDRAFEAAHIDHTVLPVELVSAITGECIGTAWLSIMQDAYSRVVLAHCLTLEAPSVRVLMILLRECVRRHRRLPQRIIVDHGREFQSLYLEQLLVRFDVELVRRPPGSPRHGSVVESMFGSTEQEVIRQLTGSTTNRELDRSLSKSHEPKRQAIWTPDALDDLLEEYFYEVYPERRHTGIHDTPSRLFRESLAEAGTPNNVHIQYDMHFYILTLPAVTGESRTIRQGQIRVNHLQYRPMGVAATNHNGESVPVRYDPYDPTYVYAYIRDQWYECVTTSDLLRQARERRVRHLTLEVAGRARNSGRQYRNPTSEWIDFARRIRETESGLARAADRPDESTQSSASNDEAQGPSEEGGDDDDRPTPLSSTFAPKRHK